MTQLIMPSGSQRLSFTIRCSRQGKLYTFLPALIARTIRRAANSAVISCGMWNVFDSVIGVVTKPGQIVVARTPVPRRWMRSPSMYEFTAALLAQYEDSDG